ncbi:MAG: DHH family phosphoesterase, partial [Myxococcota bacterium]
MEGMIWRERNVVAQEVCVNLERTLGIHPLTARLLALRELDAPEQAARFLSPSWEDVPHPETMKGMREACMRIAQALELGERILIYGDYDVDGVTSTSLLYLFLLELGVTRSRLCTFIPHRVKHGYGLQKSCLPELLKQSCSLMITVDCGISSVEEITLLQKAGTDVIVLDHHQPPP